MKIKEMDKFIAHCNKYFGQSNPTILHPIVEKPLHIDILLYKPNEKYPFWKLVTMGASDYKMPSVPNSIGLFNEYVMFVDPDVDLTDKKVLPWYDNHLRIVAAFAYYHKTHISYCHSFEWEKEKPDDEMIAAFIEFPQIIEEFGFLKCQMSIFKTVICLQVVLLNKNELDKLMEIGPQKFSDYLYPENDDKKHFICERYRSQKF